MKNNQYARIGKTLPLDLYIDRSGIKDHSNGKQEQEVKQLENTMKY